MSSPGSAAAWAEDEHDELPPLPQMLAQIQPRSSGQRSHGTKGRSLLAYDHFMTQEEARIHCESVISTAAESGNFIHSDVNIT